MREHIEVTSPPARSARARQVCGMFDLEPAAGSRVVWHVEVPLEDKAWHIGLIAGPSGCGKSTVARRFFPEMDRPSAFAEWVGRGAVVDAFPAEMPIKEVVALLSAVGFSSPPAWLRPFDVLSTGQQFRVTLALLLAWTPPGQRIVFDEYTSVVDRHVAQIGSAAVARTIRQRGQQFVAVTCHEDVEEWLQPDWIYRPAENLFTWRCLRRRPRIDLDIVRVQASAWQLFAPHHYLSHALNPSAVCFLASWREQPAAFSAWLPFVGKGRCRREHRTVCLPDFQGVGIGNAVSDFVASLWAGLGYRAISTTTHPAMIQSRLASKNWRMHRAPSLAQGHDRKVRHATTRLTAGFEYIGPAQPPTLARVLL